MAIFNSCLLVYQRVPWWVNEHTCGTPDLFPFGTWSTFTVRKLHIYNFFIGQYMQLHPTWFPQIIPYIDDFPIKTSIDQAFSMAKLGKYQMVHPTWFLQHISSLPRTFTKLNKDQAGSAVASCSQLDGSWRSENHMDDDYGYPHDFGNLHVTLWY